MKKQFFIFSVMFLFSFSIFSQENANSQQDTTKINTGVVNTEIIINFDFNDCNIKTEFNEGLNQFIANLAKSEHNNVIIFGHTDSVGSNADNEKLGLCRANSVKDYFISKGISENRIQVISKGEKAPIADNSTEDGAYKNRRVVVDFIERK